MGYRKDAAISDETLIGYILSALPEDELAFVEDQILLESIAGKSVLTQRIIDLRELLKPIQAIHTDNFEPSSDLVRRTLANIDLESNAEAGTARSEHSDAPWLEGEPNDSRNCGASGSQKLASNGLNSVVVQVDGEHWKPMAWFDTLATLAVCFVVVCLILPGIWNAREQSRRVVCADKLRNLGLAMHDFANLRGTGEFPKIDPKGVMSFAGVYAIRLKDSDLIQDASQVWCPANEGMRIVVQLPSAEQYSRSSAAAKEAWRRSVGGTYAYNLGYLVDGYYATPALSGPSNQPIIGDLAYYQSSDRIPTRTAHSQDTSNIMYLDGRVQTLKMVQLGAQSSGVDNPYLNNAHIRAAGMNLSDSCLAPSFIAPLSE